MISVDAALERVLALVAPVGAETVPLARADGRVLARDAVAGRAQPPFSASAMDGYAVASDDVAPGAVFRVIGAAPAGRRFAGRVGRGEAVRVFTGAPMPDGTDRVVIQEDATAEDDRIVVGAGPDPGPYIRPRAGDFDAGDRLFAGTALTPAHVMLLAAMNVAEVTVARRPRVAILATGDELVPPGGAPRDDQIIASNGPGLAALLARAGADPCLLPIARDDVEVLRGALALAVDADLIVTTGGASVGEHDLMARAAGALGLERAFHKVAMRPGKPLMAGRLEGVPLVGLPGNPVSCFVCGTVFLVPAIHAMTGRPAGPLPRRHAPLAAALPANGPREHYMRATWEARALRAAPSQDSSLQRVLAEAQALIVRPPFDPPRTTGETVAYLPLAHE